jgi:hypothetical protein
VKVTLGEAFGGQLSALRAQIQQQPKPKAKPAPAPTPPPQPLPLLDEGQIVGDFLHWLLAHPDHLLAVADGKLSEVQVAYFKDTSP